MAIRKKKCTMAESPEKYAWIDEKQRILYFAPEEGCALYSASPAPFWEHILKLMRQGYRIG